MSHLIRGLLLAGVGPAVLLCQSVGGAGAIEGVVTDPSGAAVPNASVELSNPITKFTKSTQADTSGSFRLSNVPPNSYHLTVNAPGFAAAAQDLNVRSSVPVS